MSEEINAEIREAIIEALPRDTSLHGQPPEPRHVYVPPSHLKALRLECDLVIGARGVGKTFWSAALRSEDIRRLLGKAAPDLSNLDVRSGYSERSELDAYPDSETFQQLLGQHYEPYDVWRAIIGRWLAGVVSQNIPRGDWKKTLFWAKNEPEAFGRLLERANAKLENQNKHALIAFDALDRISLDWATMDKIVRDLLRIILFLKPFRHLHGKVFLREDQFESRQVKDFPDASKVLASRLELTWALQDLHGLLWQYLGNGLGVHGETLRTKAKEAFSPSPFRKIDSVWTLTDAAKRGEGIQRKLFACLAGSWMGRDPRRGTPYTWSVGHLADGRGRTSPRSFLAAIRVAAEDSGERYRDYAFPLHYESIKKGVQEASNIRVSELADEDYPWIKTVMDKLGGLTVPCEFGDIEERWSKGLGEDPRDIIKEIEKLPPEHLKDGWKGVCLDMVKLGIFEPMRDGRINMPDLYRVGFGLGRRGGVKPIVRQSKE